LVQQESVKKAEVAASNVMQDVQNYTAAAAAASSQPAWLPKQPSADQGTCVMLGCNAMLVYALAKQVFHISLISFQTDC